MSFLGKRLLPMVCVVLGLGCGDDDRPIEDAGIAEDASPTWPTGWELLPSSPRPHGFVSPALLPDGRVILVSGESAGRYNSYLEALDPATGTWQEGPEFVSVGNETTTVLPTGEVLVVGTASTDEASSDPRLRVPGLRGFANRVLLVSGDLTPRMTTNTLTMRAAHTGTLLPTGEVLVAGGATLETMDGPVVPTATAEVYDRDGETWRAVAPMAEARLHHRATLLESGEVLVTGGRDMGETFFASVEIYDPATDTWRAGAPMSTPRAGHAAVRLGSGRVLVAGGIASVDETSASAEVYDPLSDTWTSVAPMGRAAGFPASTELPSGDALIVGGATPDGSSSHGQALIFEDGSNEWVSLPDIPGGGSGTFTYEGRYGGGAVLLPDGYVVLVGGIGRGGIEARETLMSDAPFLP